MNSFIDLLIQKLIETKIPFNEMQVVFPTKRACILFKYKFALHFKRPQWLPQTSSIEDFILNLSALEKANDLFLITQLFEAYKKFDSQIEFDSFYNWGKILLADFDETDSYLIDQNKLYVTLQNFAEVDNSFGMNEEEWQSLISFWKSIYNGSPTKLRQQFINSWKILPDVLNEFKQNLYAAGKVYRGLAYRTVAENIQTQKLSHTVFAGFYALSTSEEYIIKYLLDNNMASMFWDADAYYLNNPIQEAGYYLRNNLLLHERYRNNSTILKTDTGLSFADEKEINLTGIPLKVGQAKFTGNKLKTLIDTNQLDDAKTVIVLPDEHLLTPMLHALPFIENVNVTMGYPIKHTQVYSWLNIYIQCLQNRSNESVFFKDDLMLIFNHPLAGNYLGNKQHEFIDRLNASVTTLININKLNTIAENHILQLLCMPTINMFECVAATSAFIDFLFINLSSALNTIEHEALVNLQNQFKQQFETVVNNASLSTKSAWLLIADTIKNLRIPFEGKAATGLQIMGFLETRVLDFDRVILLSANENYLPAAKASSSYIPYNLRKAFGLPTAENQNAIYAYHFYRLLQRARYIDILYNTELNRTGGGEPSRYLLQIKYELLKTNPAIKFTDSIYTTPIHSIEQNAITIYKTAAIENKLKLKYVYTNGNTNQFSASSLSTYIKCKLAFYFKYIIEIKTETETTDTIDAATFGNI
ncbi:MAG TPA: hypothetical protein PLO59_03995, partial [Bacteroidia bacterium]|nr:hypothetical protein [Bacteroidia bacterium]